jgi:hypothetical protein
MAAMNKQLLLFESRAVSKLLLDGRGKPNQHDMYAFLASPRTLLAGGPMCGNLSHRPNRVGHIHCSRLHLPARLSGPWDLPQFLSQHSH